MGCAYDAAQGRRPAPPAEDYEAMYAAADRYRTRFGEAAPVYQFMGHPRELAAAMARGEPVTDVELYRRLGMTPPPPDVEL